MQKFIDTYINLNLKDYKNIGIDLEITKLLGLIFIGAMVAAVLLNLTKASSATVIKALLRHECKTEDGAKSLTELRISTPFTRHVAFSDYGRLKRLLRRVGEVEYSYDEFVRLQKEKKKPASLDRATTKLYIPEERLDEAKRLFDKGSPTVLDSVLICVLLLALYVCLLFIMPSALSFINSLL